MDKNISKIGNNIKKFRKNASLTQQQLADTLGKTESTIRKYENGSIEPPLSVLNEISKILKVTIWDLIGVDRQTAKEHGDTVKEWGLFYLDENERKEHEMQGLLYAQEEKEILLYWQNFLNPFLKILGYEGHHMFFSNGEYTLILQENNQDKWQIRLEDAKKSIIDSLDLVRYCLKRACTEITEETKRSQQELKQSPHVSNFDQKLKQLDEKIEERTNPTEKKMSALEKAPDKKIVTHADSIDKLP